ncbi:hypothetical protein BC343_09830 [Mucilaginibacter pedocola]|uniref:Uncharacterized protein n=2 Tax=Mucilaginibacter pedocola TaxID=1792845 RepID=A0A1S9PCM8_9SPHI|nr:hypothetical protein BC343_09830 [Mucilaginibacter pedocola]
MSPTRHITTAREFMAINQAFALLPPLHQRVLKEHLAGISFLDDMPNTALTSIVESADSVRRYHITFRAAILKQTVSEWLAEKERTCFIPDSSGTSISFIAGNLNAIVYVLLHETTHVVDGSLDIFHDTSKGFANQFTGGVWADRLTFATPDSLLNKNRFRRGGKPLPYSSTIAIYKALQQTPFVSLYSTSSWSEDLAECLTVYHLTKKMKQPFKLQLSNNGKVIFSNEPLKNSKVTQRMKSLEMFYSKS